MDELLLCPILHIIHEQHYVNASLAGLYKFEEGGVCGGGGVYGVGSHPEVLLTAVDHLPYLLEKHIAFHYELSEGEPDDGL
jgi:hypothetical protein